MYVISANYHNQCLFLFQEIPKDSQDNYIKDNKETKAAPNKNLNGETVS